MYVIAIAELDKPLDEEVPALAAILGLSAYDVRLALHATPPSIVLRTPSRELAESTMAGLRARRCTALLVDLAEVVPAGRMVAVRRFALEEDGLRAHENGPRLGWDDLAVIIRVATTTNVERTQMERDLVNHRGMPATVEREVTHLEREHEQTLYLFTRSGAVPWVLRARDARYLGLGAGLRATAHDNFLATIDVLRRRAPQAVYDDRFALHPLTRHNTVQVRGDHRSTNTIADAGIDLPVHVLARWLVAPSNGPYRDGRA